MSFKQEYRKCWKFIKESRNCFLAIFVVFAASIAFGFAFPVFFTDFMKRFIDEIVSKTAGFDFFQMFIFIFENNLSTSFIGIASGIFFGIIPLFLAFFNGYVLGFVAEKTSSVLGLGILWRLAPHGIFEIPALILSLGLGLRLGTFFLNVREIRNFPDHPKNPTNKLKGFFGKKRKFSYFVMQALKVFLFVILPLLVIAALIETGLVFLVK